MIQSDITAPILSYDDINKRAEDLLREYKRNKILPVDIEAIAGRIGVRRIGVRSILLAFCLLPLKFC